MQVVFAQHCKNAENGTLPVAWLCGSCIILYMDNAQRDSNMNDTRQELIQTLWTVSRNLIIYLEVPGVLPDIEAPAWFAENLADKSNGELRTIIRNVA